MQSKILNPLRNPEISVIIPTFNCRDFINEAIQSVLSQTYKNFEILVIDDGSTDNTKEILMSYIDSGTLRFFQQKNKGPSAARNTGVLNAKGEFIAFLDADDLWEGDKLEKSIRFLEEHKFDWICTGMKKIKKNGEISIKRIPEDSCFLDSRTKEIRQLKNGLLYFSSVTVRTQTILARRKCFDCVGLFDESITICEDTDLWLRFEEAGFRGGYLDEFLTIYRYNERGLTKNKKIDGLNEYVKVLKKHVLILGLHNKMIRNSFSDCLWQVADLYFTRKRVIKSIKYIFKSLYYNPKKIFRILRKIVSLKNKSLWRK